MRVHFEGNFEVDDRFIKRYFFREWLVCCSKNIWRSLLNNISKILVNILNRCQEEIKLIIPRYLVITEVEKIAKKKNYEWVIYKLSDSSNKKDKCFKLAGSRDCKDIGILKVLAGLRIELVEKALKNSFKKVQVLEKKASENKTDIFTAALVKNFANKIIQEFGLKNREKNKEALVIYKILRRKRASIFKAAVISDILKIIETLGLKNREIKEEILKFILEVNKKSKKRVNFLVGIDLKMNEIEKKTAKKTVRWQNKKIYRDRLVNRENKKIAKKKNNKGGIYKLSARGNKKDKCLRLAASRDCKDIVVLEFLTARRTKLVEKALKNSFKKAQVLEKKAREFICEVLRKNQTDIFTAVVIRDIYKSLEELRGKIISTKVDRFKLIIEANKKSRKRFKSLAGINFKTNEIEKKTAKKTVRWQDGKIYQSEGLTNREEREEIAVKDVEKIAKKKNNEWGIYKLSDRGNKKDKCLRLSASRDCKDIGILEVLAGRRIELVEKALKNSLKKAQFLEKKASENKTDIYKIIESFGSLKNREIEEEILKFILEVNKKSKKRVNFLVGIDLKMNEIEKKTAKKTVRWQDGKIYQSDRLAKGEDREITAKKTVRWQDGKIYQSDRLVNRENKKIAVNYSKIYFLPGGFKKILAHLKQVRGRKYNNNQLFKTRIVNIAKLRE